MGELWAIFLTIFLAELGDKTQLATLLFATNKQHSSWTIFLASAGALTATSAIAVLVGGAGAKYLEAVPLRLIAGLGFIALGVWQVVDHVRGGA